MSTRQNGEKPIFKEALKLKTAAERKAYVEKVCADDPTLKARIFALLQAREDKGDFLEALLDEPVVTIDDQELKEKSGTVIGRYMLLEKIGEGGMAVVYMAEQQEPINRKVALKIIKLGMDTKSVIARFEAERQALAMMDHPNIAKVFDAGATESGRPYFVMELVEGDSITTYCDQNRLGTKERLGLFIQVCSAIQHAHQKGIIHRDLKPSNILITLQDSTPTPKVIDFGIAKATKQRLTEKTLFTRYAQMIGTPAYMSPEQAELSDLEIDIRTDIYSLGVLLYELLTGTTPFSEEQLRKAGYLEMQRIICQEEPEKPSTKLTTLGEKLTDIAEYRGSAPDVLTKAVQGDLDWIVMKSLEKDRSRRYETADAFAGDIQRHLEDKPILARPPELMYRLQKFLRRNRLQVAAVLMLVLLGVAITFSLSIWNKYQDHLTDSESFNHKQTLARARKLFSERDFPAALKEAESLLNSRHVGPEAKLLYAGILFGSDDPDGAVIRLKNLLDEKPEIAGAARALLERINLETALIDTERSARAVLLPGKTIYVDANATGTNNGSSWENAYKYLQDALAATSRGDQIKVAKGIYKPDQGAGITQGDRYATFKLKSGVAVYGGINGGKSILSGDLNGDDGPDFAGNDENSYHVVTGSGADETAVLDGFTITAGNANGNELHDTGGGMYNNGNNSSPMVTNCTFSGNSAREGGGMYSTYESSPIVTRCTFINNSAEAGGGMSNAFCTPVVTDCVFTSNSANKSGGGMCNVNEGNPTVTNCTFTDNEANIDGGGMFNHRSDTRSILTNCIFSRNSATGKGGGIFNVEDCEPMIINCTFTGNKANAGGGMYSTYESSPIVTGCTFTDNEANINGGGMYNEGKSSPVITDCAFSGNSAREGGGIWNWDNCNPTITNCIFGGNSATKQGSGIFNKLDCKPMITNCTLSGNSAKEGGALYIWNNSSSKLSNCILWGNTADKGPQIALAENSSVTVNYCNLQGGLPEIAIEDPNSSVTGGSGNIDTNPLFVNAANAEYYLRTSSPCVDAGDNSVLPKTVVEDLDGNPRIINDKVDMGAYEYSRLQSPHMRAGNPSPADGASDITRFPTLKWTAGAEAYKHDLYIGTDLVAVRNASMRSPEYKGTKGLGSESYEPPELQKDTTYYWRVDEYNTDAMISKGRIWRFTTVTEQDQTLSSQIGSSEPEKTTEEQSETLIQKDQEEP